MTEMGENEVMADDGRVGVACCLPVPCPSSRSNPMSIIICSHDNDVKETSVVNIHVYKYIRLQQQEYPASRQLRTFSRAVVDGRHGLRTTIPRR